MAPSADPPLHVLIDAAGHVIAMARGAGRPTIDRIADQAKRQLDELDPLGDTRFVSMPSVEYPVFPRSGSRLIRAQAESAWVDPACSCCLLNDPLRTSPECDGLNDGRVG